MYKRQAEELEDVNEKFAKYNTALSELKEILSIAQMDIALGTAGETAEYASANFKVTADKIKAEVTRATQAEEVLKGSLDIQADRIKAEVERATKEEGKLKSSLELQADMIESKVEIDEIGSYVQQYYNRVLIGFNNDSKYVQITAGQIAIYDYGITDSKKRAVLNESGNHFYRDGYYVCLLYTSKESVSEEINSVATSKLNVAKGLIEAEVTRATEAERTLAADLKNVKQDIEEFQGNIDGAFRDGIITEAEKISIEKYLNELKKDNKSILKRCV